MPEGDTLFRIAATLRPVLVGQSVRRVRSPHESIAQSRLEGLRIDAVESRGKNLLITFEDGRVLHTHLRMKGAWHLYRPGERWQKSEAWMRVALEVERAVAVCFGAPVVRLLSPAALARDPVMGSLGPDCLSPTFDGGDVLARMRGATVSLAEALIDQRICSGIGNVYKSEVLFLERLDPFAPVHRFSDAELTSVLERVRSLMLMNVAPGKARVPFRSAPEPFLFRGRTTRVSQGGGGTRYWVYGRSGEPCFACSTWVRMRRHGAGHRSTYFCPSCQQARAEDGSPYSHVPTYSQT